MRTRMTIDQILAGLDAIEASLRDSQQRNQIISSVINDLAQEELPPSQREYLDDVQDLLNIHLNTIENGYTQIKALRMASGAPGCPFLDALLMIWADMLDITELTAEAAKFCLDGASHTVHATQFALMAAESATKAACNSVKAGAAMTKSAANGAVSGLAAAAPAIEVAFKASSGAFSLISGAEAVQSTQLIAESASHSADGAAREVHSNEHLAEAAASFAAAAEHLAFAGAKAEHMAAVYEFMEGVIAVEPVPEFPLPICGWEIDDPYDWVAGDQTATIVEEVVEPIVSMIPPSPIIQGANTTTLVSEYTESEGYEPPKMEFLGGGSIF